MGQKQQPEDWSEDKTRNETDIIKTRVTRMIEQELRDDPYAQEAFSKLLRQAIEEAEKLFDHPLKQYMLFRRSEEHTSELQSRGHIVCRLLLEKQNSTYSKVF